MNASEAQSFLQQDITSSARLEYEPGCFILDACLNAELLISVDTLVSGVHFLEDTSPGQIAFKSLAVNLSDIASMGGDPFGYTLSLTCPEYKQDWFSEFRDGLRKISVSYGLAMLSCIVEPGPLSITIQILGCVPKGQALLRNTAQVGDAVFVSGRPGDAAGALKLLLENKAGEEVPESLRQRLNTPEPRVALGQALREIANACIDVSDGLLADLGHILEQSKIGAIVELEKIPLSEILRSRFSLEQAQMLALGGGDDYELCFTVPAININMVEGIAGSLKLPCTRIGQIVESPGLQIQDAVGNLVHPGRVGYDHFASN